jgi:hypothetical protein
MSQNILNFGGLARREVIFVNTVASEIGFRLEHFQQFLVSHVAKTREPTLE